MDILRSRVTAISSFKNMTKANEKEKVLQKHLFKNLWLVDAAWERAALGGRMEEDLRGVSPGLFARDEKGAKIEGRLDIRYATASGRHVIVELKRYAVRPDVTDLAKQGLKYFTALRDLLTQQKRGLEPIEVIFVLGEAPKASGRGRLSEDDYIEKTLSPCNGRYVLQTSSGAAGRPDFPW